ncbi:nitrophenyl compound nitroreductase subunit ArsF family protein [Candidatus Bipolaricaulota bacterium]
MKTARIAATAALLLFVAATVGVLIAQEVSHSSVAGEPSVPGTPIGSTGEGTDLVAENLLSNSSEPPMPIADVPVDAPVDDDVQTAESSGGDDADPSTAVTSNAGTDPKTATVVDAIYFHNTVRCRTCKKIEETARAVVEADFADEVASGVLQWSAINMENERHYVEEYDLVKPTLVLVRRTGNETEQWIALDETWSLIGSETRFSMYVTEQVRAFLGGNP